MQVGNITCASPRFALTRCHSSAQQKKPRHRRSKEERRAMVETFVTNFRNTNNGSFPSLNLTHKEVGGSYYIVRDIMRDIIQENKVLGPGDLNMQSLTLEHVPVQPEICENGNTSTSAELHLGAGSEEEYIVVESVNQGSNLPLEVLENNLFENEGEILHSLNGKGFEQMELLNYKEDDNKLIAEENCTDNAGKRPFDDVSESDLHKIEDVQGLVDNKIEEKMDEPKINTKVGEVDEVSETDGPLTYNEAIIVNSNEGPRETSKSDEGFEGSTAVQNEHIQESIMEVGEKTVTDDSKSDIGELKDEVLESAEIISVNMSEKLESSVELMDLDVKKDLKEESAGNMTVETVEISNSEIKKDERGQSSESNGKMSLDENKKSSSFTGTVETLGSNRGLEVGRTVVEVEQFPLPRVNSSLNSENPDRASASIDAKEREMESFEVKAPAAVVTKTETKPELENPSAGKSLDTVPGAEHGATLNVSAKTKWRELTPRTPINEYLLHRHESYLKLDFLTPEISMDASSNREGVKKSRAKAENNPFWNTVRAFVTAIIKFWTE